MADHQMGQIKIAEATISSMPLFVTTKHASVDAAADIHVDRSVPKTRFAAIATVAKFHPSASSVAIGGTD
ncbi:hypothetical protein ACFX2I_021178 [Malus domestica]